jgi:hypothetical protein
MYAVRAANTDAAKVYAADTYAKSLRIGVRLIEFIKNTGKIQIALSNYFSSSEVIYRQFGKSKFANW